MQKKKVNKNKMEEQIGLNNFFDEDQKTRITRILEGNMSVEHAMTNFNINISEFYAGYEGISDMKIPAWWTKENWKIFHQKDNELYELVKSHSEAIMRINTEQKNYNRIMLAVIIVERTDFIGVNEEIEEAEKCFIRSTDLVSEIKEKIKASEAGLQEVLKLFKPLLN